MGLKNSRVRMHLDYIQFYLDKHVPRLCQFLSNNGLSHEFFSTNWIITLFANVVNPGVLFKIWDFFIIYGWKFFNSLALDWCSRVYLYNSWFILRLISCYEGSRIRSDRISSLWITGQCWFNKTWRIQKNYTVIFRGISFWSFSWMPSLNRCICWV